MADQQSQAPASSSTFGQHDNAYVPHHISDHTKALQMSVRTENGWVNISDTLDQMNDRKDLHAVHDQVEKAQEDIVNAQSAADDAVSRADSAVKAAAVTSDAVAGLQSNVANKADKSQITQLSNVIQSKVSTSDFTSKVSQLSNDINARVTKGDLLSQINIEAGRTLIQSDKIYLDADSVVFGKDSKAFIPDAAITELNADKITAGTLRGISIINGNANGGGEFLSVGTPDVEDDGTGNKKYLYPIIQISNGGLLFSTSNSSGKVANSSDVHYALIQGRGNMYDHQGRSPSIIMDAPGGFELNNLPFDNVSDASADVRVGHPIDLDALDDSSKNLRDYSVSQITLTATQPEQLASSELEVNSKDGVILRGPSSLARLSVGSGDKNEDVHVDLPDDDNGSEFSIQKNNHFTIQVGGGSKKDELQFTTIGRQGFHSYSAGTIYFDRNDHGSWHENLGLFDVFGNFVVSGGQKNSIVKTSQGWTAIHAYETAEYYFGDIGENNTGANGKVTIGIDQLFGQTVNTDMQYQVFITPYSNAHVWVSQRLKNRFVVESDQPNAEFGWEMKARRKGFEHTRLTNFSDLIK